MYLITAYFDNNTNIKLQHLIDEVAMTTGNDFMIKNDVVPHMTISAFEQRSDERAIQLFDEVADTFKYDDIMIPSIGVFLPYVIYAEAVLNEYLQTTVSEVYDVLSQDGEIRINKYYYTFNWIPHITIGKTLDKVQLQEAFKVLQDKFQPMKATIVSFGLSKPNPMRNLRMCGRLSENSLQRKLIPTLPDNLA